MKIVVNGTERTVDGSSTLQCLLDSLGTSVSKFAVELNGEIIPASARANTALHENDRIEIIQFVGGG
jgi:sulfur carrier protein